MAGCSTPTIDPSPSGTGSTAVSPVTASAPSSSPRPSPAKTYKPATAQGPAQNVPVPVLSTAAKEFSKAGLEAFARYWYATLSYAYETGDTKPMTAITDPSCQTCAKAKASITDWYATKGWIVGGKLNISSSTSTFEKTPDGTYQAIVVVRQDKVTFINPDKSVDEDLPVSIAQADIVIADFRDGKWHCRIAQKLS